jgi:hypothetical protein
MMLDLLKRRISHKVDCQCLDHHQSNYNHNINLSFSNDSGYLDPGGNSGGGFDDAVASSVGGALLAFLLDFEEFPAFPLETMPFLGGI